MPVDSSRHASFHRTLLGDHQYFGLSKFDLFKNEHTCHQQRVCLKPSLVIKETRVALAPNPMLHGENGQEPSEAYRVKGKEHAKCSYVYCMYPDHTIRKLRTQ